MGSKQVDKFFSKVGLKRTRTTITLEKKLNIIQRSEQGERASLIAKTEHLPSSTVRTILGNSDRIKRLSKVAAPRNAARRILRNTNGIMDEMEQKLTIWCEKELQQGDPIGLEKLRNKALELYRDLAKNVSNVEPFTASWEWFNKYEKRVNLLKGTTDTELFSMHDKTSVQNDLALSFNDIVKQNEYKPQQIFCVAETVLYWKKMPSKTYASSSEKCSEELKDRFILLMGGNAQGNFKLKPLLVYHLENPKALKGYPKSKLPVIWKTNKKLLLTQLSFSDWFTSYFCPAVEQFCWKNNLPNKALLVLDASAGYPINLDDLSNNIKVLYLSSDTIPLLQSSDHSLFKMFKAHYLRTALLHAVAATETADSQIEFWDTYDVKKAIINISDAWNDVKSSTMNWAWKELYPDCVTNTREPELVEDILKIVVDLAKELGIEDINTCDAQELLELQNEKLTEREIQQLEKHRAREEFMDDDEDAFPIKALTTSTLREAMDNLEAAMAIYKEYDPDSERSSTVCRNIENAVTCYRQLYKKKRKIVSIDLVDLNRSTNTITEQSSLYEGQTASQRELQSTLNDYNVTFIKEEICDSPLFPI